MGLIMFKYDLFMTEQKEGETDSVKKKLNLANSTFGSGCLF